SPHRQSLTSTRFPYTTLFRSVAVDDVSETVVVMAIWDGAAPALWGVPYPDPRLPELGLRCISPPPPADAAAAFGAELVDAAAYEDRKSTRLNSSHLVISYAVF